MLLVFIIPHGCIYAIVLWYVAICPVPLICCIWHISMYHLSFVSYFAHGGLFRIIQLKKSMKEVEDKHKIHLQKAQQLMQKQVSSSSCIRA